MKRIVIIVIFFCLGIGIYSSIFCAENIENAGSETDKVVISFTYTDPEEVVKIVTDTVDIFQDFPFSFPTGEEALDYWFEKGRYVIMVNPFPSSRSILIYLYGIRKLENGEFYCNMDCLIYDYGTDTPSRIIGADDIDNDFPISTCKIGDKVESIIEKLNLDIRTNGLERIRFEKVAPNVNGGIDINTPINFWIKSDTLDRISIGEVDSLLQVILQ